MNEATKIEGPKVPLTAEQVDAYRNALDEVKGSYEGIGRVAIETGLSRGEMAHLTEEWLLLNQDLPKIRVPPGEQECQSGSDPPCPHCRQKRDGVWRAYRLPRTVPVFDSETAELLRVLLRHQDTLGSLDRIQDAVQWISETAGIEREEGTVQVKTLQNTFIVKLLDDGFSIDEICRIMGYEQPTKSHQYSSGTPAKIKALGRYCEGRYPFYCNAEITSRDKYGDTCSKRVQQRDGRCLHHDRDWGRCRAIGIDGSPCMNRVSDSDSRCPQHSEQEEVCGYRLDDGSKCQIGVSGDERCLYHREQTVAICGHPTDGGICRKRVSEESEKCAYHREGEDFARCGATLDDGETCELKVSEPGEKCTYHRDQ